MHEHLHRFLLYCGANNSFVFLFIVIVRTFKLFKQVLLNSIMSLGIPAKLVASPVGLGEGPHWSHEEQALYYVDIFEQDVHRYHPGTSTHSKLHIEGGPVSLVVPHSTKENQLIVSVGRDLAAVTWENKTKSTAISTMTKLASVEQEHSQNRFNDGKCDDIGRLWAGTMGNTDIPDNTKPYLGNLYRLDDPNKISSVINKVSISNGLAWTRDNSTFFHIDSCAFKVDAYTCDFMQGTLSNKRTVLDYKKAGITEAFPDGMTIDTAGRLWVASFGAGKVHCIDPIAQKVIGYVAVPANNVTSVAWGGPDLSDLYITTTTKNMTPEQLKQQPEAGAVFMAHGIGSRGYVAHSCNVQY